MLNVRGDHARLELERNLVEIARRRADCSGDCAEDAPPPVTAVQARLVQPGGDELVGELRDRERAVVGVEAIEAHYEAVTRILIIRMLGGHQHMRALAGKELILLAIAGAAADVRIVCRWCCSRLLPEPDGEVFGTDRFPKCLVLADLI